MIRPALLVLLLLLGACAAPERQRFGPAVATPRLEAGAIVAADGYRLPLEVWEAEPPRAVFVALHGFNDYRRHIARAAQWWAANGITTYAFDQRGFGETERPGIWAGQDALTADAATALRLARARHPALPVHFIGTSMGGAVALLAAAEGVEADGLVLVAPATWGGRAMNPIFRWLLRLWSRLAPAGTATGRGLDRLASDNIEMLKALGRDPLVIKRSRADTLQGLTDTMGAALEAAGGVRPPILMLYGAHDEIILPAPIKALLGEIRAPLRLAVYPDGWHMLLRDCDARTVWRDVVAWVGDRTAPLPSKAEHNPSIPIPWAGIGERQKVRAACADVGSDVGSS